MNTRSKRPRLLSPLVPRGKHRPLTVSATHTHNFMINDTIVDWLKNNEHKRRGSYTRGGSDGFTSFIQKKGIDFENKLVEYLRDSGHPIVTVGEFISDETCRKTINLMNEGAPILHSAPVRNNYNKTQGIIDILVRSDYINNLVDKNPLSKDEENKGAHKFGTKYHYVVIDIKFSTIPLRSDGVHILNTGHYPAYKAQTLIYTQAVGRIQGYTAPYAFIMGRRWKFRSNCVKYSGLNCCERMGRIDFHGFDKSYIQRTKDALAWVRDVKNNGWKWSVDPPSREELYPNMCIDSGKWNSEKKRIADSIGEMTNIWYVGVKNRKKALESGVTSWKDELCTAKRMGFSGKRANVIDKILHINRQNKHKILPKVIKNNAHEWKTEHTEIFVDFETLSDIFCGFDQLPEQRKSDMIFMIGVGWEEDDVWNYKNFICNSPTADEEFRIMDDFVSFIRDMGYPIIRHWHAEESFWTSAENRQFNSTEDWNRKNTISDHWNGMEWADMCDIFRQEPVVVKGCYKFGLKEIAGAMHKHNMIKTSLTSNCKSGMSAMVNAWECYQKTTNPATCDTMKDVAKYNEFDCKVLWEILTYLRENHT